MHSRALCGFYYTYCFLHTVYPVPVTVINSNSTQHIPHSTYHTHIPSHAKKNPLPSPSSLPSI